MKKMWLWGVLILIVLSLYPNRVKADVFYYTGSALVGSNGNVLSSKDLMISINEDVIIVPERLSTNWNGNEVEVKGFLSFLESKYSNYCVDRKFITTNGSEVWLTKWYKDLEVDIDNSVEMILTAIKSQNRKVTLKVRKSPETEDYIEVSIAEQMVYLYKEGSLFYETPCVTGKKDGKHDTLVGIFQVYAKDKERYLQGVEEGDEYKTWVDYWMPFNGGQGLHDASWRMDFGSDIYVYSGSHGCVNLPPESAKVIFENIDVGCPVYVYDIKEG